MSYYACIELEGPELQILDKLSVLFSPSQNHLTPKSKMYLGGQFEGQCLVYKPNTQKCLTPISFMWMPLTNDGKRKLWLWCHPASYDALAETLHSVLQSSTDSSIDEPPMKKQKNDKEASAVTMTLLRDTQKLARFRLIGPLSMAILKHALHPSLPPRQNYERKTAPSAWWTEELHSKDIHEHQLQFWNSTQGNTSTMLPNRIVSLVIRDPRIFKPIKPKLAIQKLTSRIVFIHG